MYNDRNSSGMGAANKKRRSIQDAQSHRQSPRPKLSLSEMFISGRGVDRINPRAPRRANERRRDIVTKPLVDRARDQKRNLGSGHENIADSAVTLWTVPSLNYTLKIIDR